VREGQATSDVRAMLEEIGGRLTQVAQSVETVGRTVTTLAEGLAGVGAEGPVQATTRRLIELALGGLAVPLTDPKGVSRGSRREKAAERIDIQGRLLEELEMAVVEVGTASSQHGDQVVAIGIEGNGSKRVLGIQPGSGADAEVVGALAEDLYRRGLHAANGSALLLITEGTYAQDEAFLSRWPRRLQVTHCQKAVTEKVLAHLGIEIQAQVRQELQSAFDIASASTALVRLDALEQRLRNRWPGAATSLRRHAAVSLTVKRLGLGRTLERSLSTLGVLRTAIEKTHRWRNEVQGSDPLLDGAALWEQRTRRVIGYEDMPQLLAALRKTDLERTA